jgi:glycosyltransferase involved in cell wall biosynthesis
VSGRGAAPEPRISVVVPVHNRARTVGRALESALAQTRPPTEILVVDDGSTDGTAEATAAYGADVRYVHQANAGAAAARNAGVARATAPWVAFLDSDDHWAPDHLARMAAAVTATRGAAGFYFADSRRPPAGGGGTVWEASGFAIPGEHLLVDDATAWVLRDVQPMMLQSSVFRRDRYLAAGGLWAALRIREDTHLFLVMGLGGPACAVAHAGVQLTAGDGGGPRLTEALGPATAAWWLQTRLLYADVLRRFPHLAPGDRRRLRRRLATAHQRLGQGAWRARRLAPAARHLLRGARVAPAHMTTSGARRLGRAVRRGSVPAAAGGGRQRAGEGRQRVGGGIA